MGLEGPEVVRLTVPSSGGTDAGTFLVNIEPDDPDDLLLETTGWPWPNTWPVTSAE